MSLQGVREFFGNRNIVIVMLPRNATTLTAVLNCPPIPMGMLRSLLISVRRTAATMDGGYVLRGAMRSDGRMSLLVLFSFTILSQWFDAADVYILRSLNWDQQVKLFLVGS